MMTKVRACYRELSFVTCLCLASSKRSWTSDPGCFGKWADRAEILGSSPSTPHLILHPPLFALSAQTLSLIDWLMFTPSLLEDCYLGGGGTTWMSTSLGTVLLIWSCTWKSPTEGSLATFAMQSELLFTTNLTKNQIIKWNGNAAKNGQTAVVLLFLTRSLVSESSKGLPGSLSMTEGPKADDGAACAVDISLAENKSPPQLVFHP